MEAAKLVIILALGELACSGKHAEIVHVHRKDRERAFQVGESGFHGFWQSE
jgi:hypothetical protein